MLIKDYLNNLIALILVSVLFNACASMGDINKLDNLYYQHHDIEKSYKYASKYANDDFLWSFQSGILAFYAQDFDKSVEYFNVAENFFEIQSDDSVFKSGFQTLTSILVGNGLFEYSGNLYESVFVNYYKALNAMMLGDYATSRVEFNRANDRQRRSKEFFASRIEEVKNAVNTNVNDYSVEISAVDKAKMQDTLDSIINTKYQNLHQFKIYDGYVNPFISYVSGIFFLTQKDFNKANDLLKEAYGVSEEKEILNDMEILESRKNNTKSLNDEDFYTWIFIEDGRSPKKVEISFDIPLFFINRKVFMFNVALPNLDKGIEFYKRYYATTDVLEKSYANAQYTGFEVSNIGGIVANEFDVSLPYIVITSLISSSYKVYLQYVLSDNFGALGGLAGAVFSKTTTNADIRISRILPLKFIALRIKNIDSIFYLFGDGKMIYNFTIDEQCKQLCLNRDNIIYLRVLQNDIITLTHIVGEVK